MDLLEHSARILGQRDLVSPGGRLLLAVSGGNDSLVMLHLLHSLRATLGLDLHVASLNHGMRGAAGADDVSFVQQQAESLGLGVTLGSATGLNSEADARRARYDFLANAARQVGARHVVTAHHADDQVETLLLNLLRGSGLRGLAGMGLRAELPGHPQLTLLRPFLEVPRSELRAWGQSQGLEPRQDASNNDRRLRRNRLRHEILPLLRDFDPRVDQSLLRLSEIAARDHDFVQQQLGAATASELRHSDQRIRLSRSTFLALHPALQRHLVLNALRTLGNTEPGAAHVAGLVALARSGRTGQTCSLPGGMQLRIEYGDLVFESIDAEVDWSGPLLTGREPLKVRLPGKTALPGQNRALVLSRQRPAGMEAWQCLSLPPAATITLDTRRTGDRFHPVGLNGHSRSLKKWMIDRQLPQHIRMQVPLLRVDGHIAAIFDGTKIVPSSLFLARETDANACFCAICQISGSTPPQCLHLPHEALGWNKAGKTRQTTP
ncbi:MAG: tRNA lysidine(34) synthetase TilS [Anaerolineaceae bacterium]|nr:tRNA lysidine(34) synthetase TilS [Anaerolineaceae bacterium]